ncbi:WD40 repeat-like protein [Exidia glandulosa HHB12029]|uniref:WD40 repeat-like protein n=1 Tax=Exidia glandulosa HHB12029 TaxID=1314781 RepID=A0A165EJJ5_EXIGL|nr:WD40 repeat-like protein [Exidia glandulosa HHB12029]
MTDKNVRNIFHDPESPLPFRLLARNLRRNPDPKLPPLPVHKFARTSPNGPSSIVAFFPWDKKSLERLWNGALNNPGPGFAVLERQWQNIIETHHGVFAVAHGRDVRLYRTTPKVPLEQICSVVLESLPSPGSRSDDDEKNVHDDDVHALTWALNPNELRPLLVIAASRVVHVFDTVRQCANGVVKGHGGDITSLRTHPTYPQFICSTSRDFSTRFYDLQCDARFMFRDPPPPPRGYDYLGGTPFGMQSRSAAQDPKSDELPANVEGFGYGKCLGVLWGPIAGAEHLPDREVLRTRHGGHSMAVFSADFHETRSLIATCGLDQCVKIWRVPQMSSPDPKSTMFYRMQLPVFSSSAIHDGKIVSIRWIAYDLLLSESIHPLVSEEEERHRFVIWKWLAMNRYVDIDQDGKLQDPQYQDSTESCTRFTSRLTRILTLLVVSYQIISIHDVIAPKHARSSLQTGNGPPLLLIPGRGSLRVYTLKFFQPVPAPAFPHKLVEARPFCDSLEGVATSKEVQDLLKEQEVRRYARRDEPHKPWTLQAADKEHPLPVHRADLDLGSCAFSPDRQRVVAASLSGDVYVWVRYKEE